MGHDAAQLAASATRTRVAIVPTLPLRRWPPSATPHQPLHMTAGVVHPRAAQARDAPLPEMAGLVLALLACGALFWPLSWLLLWR